MKKTIKLVSILLIAMVIVSGMATISLASGDSDSSSTVDGLFKGGSADTSGLESVGTNLVDIITTVGIIVAVNCIINYRY